MPLLVPTAELQPGMKLHEPILSGGRVMLQAGKELTPSDIDVMRRRYPSLAVRIADPVLDNVLDFEDDQREQQIAARAQQMVSRSMSEVRDRFSDRTALARVDFRALQAAVDEIMEFLKANPTSAAVVSKCLDPAGAFSHHAGNVFYLSMLLGSKSLDYVIAERKRQTAVQDMKASQAHDLTPLGLGAMVIDVGLLPLQDVITSGRPLTPDDAQLMKLHPQAGAEMLPDTFPALARMMVKTHHENCAGCGYPKALPREKIHVFSRVVRIADAFVAATSEHLYKNARSPARALWEMKNGPHQAYYDPRLMEAFATLIQPFPIGAKLRLADGRYAVLVKYNRRNPFQPTIVIAYDENNQPLPREKLEKPIDLGVRRDLKLKSFHGEDLSFLYTSTSSPPPETPQVFKTAFQAAYP